MPLDFTPLTSSQFLFFLTSFVATFIVAGRWRFFRVSRKNIYFAGLVPLIVTTVLSLFVLDSLALTFGLIAAAAVIALVGRADERQPLSAAAQLFWQIVVAVLLAAFGWAIPYVSNPVGEGVLYLGGLAFPLTVLWIILVINAMNWFDGTDGLAGSISVIAMLTLAAISLLPATQDATTLSLSLVGAGATLGFLILNAPPARVYLGTVGSWFLGGYLAITAIVGGGKVATAALVLAIPLLDVLFVIIQRLLKRQRPWAGDTRHHFFHRLAAAGLTPRQIVLVISLATAALGLSAVTLQTKQKLWVFAAVAVILAFVVILLAYVSQRRTPARR